MAPWRRAAGLCFFALLWRDTDAALRDAAARAAAAGPRRETVDSARAGLNASGVADNDVAPLSSMRPPWAADVLAKHNEYRCMHGAPPLTWNDDLEAHAKQWAVIGHGQRSPPWELKDVGPFRLVGESVATKITDQGGAASPAGAVQAWYHQIEQTDGHRGEVDHYTFEFAQYTQVVWKSSTSLGCAWLHDFFVCQYGPAGNIPGEFASQVMELKKAQQHCQHAR
uniref:SCP domain-containing protein n=1 Tax=Zooxanthella nutricula TaxID=1333877 RepID=A0A7S2VM36_9DINO